MCEEAKQVLAFIFKRSGKQTLPASDVYLAISMELQWCSPKEAKAFVKRSIDSELLRETNVGITPSFKVDDIDIPTGFKPTKECFTLVDVTESDSLNKNITTEIISRVKTKHQISEEKILREIQNLSTEKMIHRDVAAIFYGKIHDCKIHDLIPRVKNELTSEKNKA